MLLEGVAIYAVLEIDSMVKMYNCNVMEVSGK